MNCGNTSRFGSYEVTVEISRDSTVMNYLSMVAYRCQPKKIKIKNENKKIEKMKTMLFRKNPHETIMAYKCQI